MTSAILYSYGCLASAALAISINDAAGRGIMTIVSLAFACTSLIVWAFDAD